MTKAQAMDFKARWETVSAIEKKESWKTPPLQKLKQLNSLMASVNKLGWYKKLKRGEIEVRNRWNHLKRAYHA